MTMASSHEVAPGDRVAKAHPFALDGRLALVTGAGGGLGYSIAHGLANAGARLLVNGRNLAKLDSAVERLRSEGAQAWPCPFDVTDSAAVGNAIADAQTRHGPLDILVNNAA